MTNFEFLQKEAQKRGYIVVSQWWIVAYLALMIAGLCVGGFVAGFISFVACPI